jgi:hypothetical protein
MPKKWEKLVERRSDFWKNYMMNESVGDIKKVFGIGIAERMTTRKGMMFIHWLNPKAVWNYSLGIERVMKRDPNFNHKVEKVFSSI